MTEQGVCPNCQGTNYHTYTSAIGVKTRACAHCMIHWRDDAAASIPEPKVEQGAPQHTTKEERATQRFRVGQIVVMHGRKNLPFRIVAARFETDEWFYAWNRKNFAAQHMLRSLTAEEIGAAASLPESQPDAAKILSDAQKIVQPLVEHERQCENLSGLDGMRFKSSKGMNQAETFEFLLSRHRRLLEIESQPSPSGDYEKEAEQFWEFMEPFIGPTGGWLVSPKKFHAAIADWLRAHDAKVGQAEQMLEPIASTLKAIALYQERSPEANRLPVSIFSLVLNAQQILAEVRNERNTDSETVRDLRGVEEQQ